jgi:hypothetical protein
VELKNHPDKVGRGDWIKLPPGSIKIDPTFNIRDMKSERTRAHIEELKVSIKAWGGVKDPVEGRMIGEEFYVTDGECRVTAVTELMRDEGFECASITCIKEAPGTDEKERILNFGVSGTKQRYNELEMAEWCRRADRLGISHEDIAAAAGWKSTASVRQHLELLSTLSEPIKDHIRNDEISATLARNIVKGVDPKVAEEMIRANLEENKRLGVGRRNTRTKVTAGTLKRDRVRINKGGHNPDVSQVTERPPAPPASNPPQTELQPTGFISSDGPMIPSLGLVNDAPRYPTTPETQLVIDTLITLTREADKNVQHNKSDDNPGYWSRELVDAIETAIVVIERQTGKLFDRAIVPDAMSQETAHADA